MSKIIPPFTTVSAVFGDSLRPYTYKAKVEDDFVPGDKAIVDAPKGLAIVTILEVHDTPQIDPNAKFKYKWIGQKIDMTEYHALMEAELQ